MPVDTNKLWIKAGKPVTLNLAKNTKGDFVKYSDKEDILLPGDKWRGLMSGAVCNEHLYMFGGTLGLDESLNDIIDYNIVNNTVSMLSTTLPAPLFGIACATVGNKIYLFGGCPREDVFFTRSRVC